MLFAICTVVLKSLISKFTPLTTSDEDWQARLDHIQAAQKFVVISTYFVGADDFGITFLQRLLERQKSGVSIYLSIDTSGQRLANYYFRKRIPQMKSLLVELQNAGGVVEFFKASGLLMDAFGAGNHVKLQINDRGDVIFGSSNISSFSFHDWFEFSAELNGDIAFHMYESLMDIFEHELPEFSWEVSEDRSGMDANYLYCNPNHIASPFCPLVTHEQNQLTNSICERITRAEKSLDIATLYFKPPMRVLETILNLAKKGVKIRIYHSHMNSIKETSLPWFPSFLIYSELVQNGVELYDVPKGQHSKIILIDDQLSLFGSYNFEYHADDRLVEAMVESNSSILFDHLRNYLERIQASDGVLKVTEEYLQQIPMGKKIKAYLTYPIRRFI